MPTYTFRCNNCEETGTRLVKIDERNMQVCDMCQLPLTRLIDRPGAVYAPTSTGGGLKV